MSRLPRSRRWSRASGTTAALAVLAVLPFALLSGCLGTGRDPAQRPEPRPALDAYHLESGTARSLAGCAYDWRVFEPHGPPASAVILGHGFLRDQDREVGLARALANAGHRAVTLDFCNMRPWNGHHVRNAADMRALAAVHGLAGRTVYAGFSAGALAALIAASEDPDALGVVTLDLVDQAGLGAAAAARLEAPLVGIAGPPAACNAMGNGRAVFAARGAIPPTRSLEAVPGATHCDFESPSDWLCELACGESPAVTGAPGTTRRERIVGRAVELVGSLAGRAP